MTERTIGTILKKIEFSLAWRGPGGGRQGHIVLDREDAEYLCRVVISIIVERDELVAEREAGAKLVRDEAESKAGQGS